MNDAQKPDHVSLNTLVVRLRVGRFVIPNLAMGAAQLPTMRFAVQFEPDGAFRYGIHGVRPPSHGRSTSRPTADQDHL